jgi:hypothetical protein
MHEIRGCCSEKYEDASPYQRKPGKELTFPSISICQKRIRHEFDIAPMLANSGLFHAMLAPSELSNELNGLCTYR